MYLETASLIHMAAAVVPASVANSRNMFCLATPASELSAWRKEETEFYREQTVAVLHLRLVYV